MKTAANNKKIRELVTLVKESKLIPKPEFQRRLVWSRDDKNNFIETVLKGYPFPEIYLADGDIDLETGQGTQLLVDGLQRVSTLVQYFNGDTNLKLTTVPAYLDLSEDEKKDFLLYDVAVRDLGSISKEEIIEIFKRLNATKYSLLDIEVNNAVYSGALKKFADQFCTLPFFEKHSIFNSTDYKRMGDLRFCLSVICTLLKGYFNRDESLEELLDRYNDDFPKEEEINFRIAKTINFIEECGFENNSRVWKKADLFTLLIEIDSLLNIKKKELEPSIVVGSLQTFYDIIDSKTAEKRLIHNVYYKSALQATNDKSNRIRRGFIIGSLLEGVEISKIETELAD